MMKLIASFLLSFYRMRKIIYNLAKRDFQQQYMGSFLGVIWVFFQPLLFIALLYVIFALGLKAGNAGDSGIPFSIYLVAGITAWQFFAGLLSSSSGSISSFSYLVKKIDFRLSVLPIVKILSALIPQLFLIVVAIILAWKEGYPPGIHTLQFFYYLPAMCFMLLGIGWLTSSTSIFIPDVNNLIQLSIRFGFWLTPLFWNISMVPEKYQWIVRLNPVVYIVDGYRGALTGNSYFWEKAGEGIYYWLLSALVCTLGLYAYRKLRPHFAEVI